MKAIILAAGCGARMRPLTDSLPKAMLTVAGQTLIERMLKALLERGISEICVVTGHCHDQLESYLTAVFPQACFTFVRNHAYRTTNNIYSMHLAFEHFPVDDDLLLIESDLVFTGAVLDRIIESKHKNVALVDKFRVGMDGTVVTLSDGLITNVVPPHLQPPGFDFTNTYKTLNIYKFSREFAQTSFRKLLSFYATTYNDNCYYELVLGILVYMQHEQIFACEVAGELWCELDDPNDVRLAEIAFSDDGRIDTLDKACGGFWSIDVVDFAFIRNMYFPNNSMFSDLRYNLPGLLQNYGSTQEILNRKLAYFLVVPEQRVCLLNGLSQLYPMLPDLLCGRTALIPEPTFGEYARSFPKGITYHDAGLESITDIPTSKSAAADVIVFVNPNNPTGSYLAGDEILGLARREPRKLILVDESFVDFSGHESVQNLLEQEALTNVWVLKSLSKCLGVPGLRLGYVYSRDEFAIKRLNDRLPVWNSNSISEYFLEILLKHRRELAESFQATIADRNKLAKELAALSRIGRVYPSAANFLLIRLNVPAVMVRDLRGALLGRWGIFVKDCSAKFSDGRAYLRIAVRLPEDNARLVHALRAELEEIARSGYTALRHAA